MKVIGYVNTGYAKRPQKRSRTRSIAGSRSIPRSRGSSSTSSHPRAQHVAYYTELTRIRSATSSGARKPSWWGTRGRPATSDTTRQDGLGRHVHLRQLRGFDRLNPPVLPKRPEPARSPPSSTRSPTPRRCARSSRKPSTRASAISTSPTRRRGATPGGSSPATGTMRSRPCRSLGDRPPLTPAPDSRPIGPMATDSARRNS